jgi:dimethylargininase
MTIKALFVFLVSVLSLDAYAVEKKYGGQNNSGFLKKVIVKQPDQAFGGADPVKWHYTATPNLEKARADHKVIVAILKSEGVEVIYHDVPTEGLADSIFVQDTALITDRGAIIFQMGKRLRVPETAAIREKLGSLEVPILGQLYGEASAEGGDMLWLDEETLLIGRGVRTNQTGISQIREFLKPHGISVLQFDLPYDQGKEACLHLESLISGIGPKAFLVYPRYMPVALMQELERRSYKVIEVSEDEYPTMGANVLAIKPGVVISIEGNPKTKQLLEKNGFTVHTYPGGEISYKAEGGPTCLTLPLLRDKE